MKVVVKFEKDVTAYSDKACEYIDTVATGELVIFGRPGEEKESSEAFKECTVRDGDVLGEYFVDGVRETCFIGLGDLASHGGFHFNDICEVFGQYGYTLKGVVKSVR